MDYKKKEYYMKPKKVQRVKPKESESFPLSYKQNIISQNAVSKVA